MMKGNDTYVRDWYPYMAYFRILAFFTQNYRSSHRITGLHIELQVKSFFRILASFTQNYRSFSTELYVYCIWRVIQSQSPISISLVSFQRNVVKETQRTTFRSLHRITGLFPQNCTSIGFGVSFLHSQISIDDLVLLGLFYQNPLKRDQGD